MMTTPVKMPSLGMTMEEGRVVSWRVKEGEAVTKGQILLEIESEKTAYEMESPADGVVARILVAEDAVVPVGATLCAIASADEAGAGPADAPQRAEPPASAVSPAPVPAGTAAAAPQAAPAAGERRRMSPRARRLAEQLGVDPAAIAGSGPHGTILEEDIRAAAAHNGKADKPAAPAAMAAPGFTLRPLSAMRRITAERLTESARSAPHFFLATEVDGTALLRYRAEHGARLAAEAGVALTITDLLVAATARTLIHHPALNASFTPEGIRLWDSVALGVAAAVEDGLIVPVIRAAERKSLIEIMRARSELVTRARAGKLTPADVELGTFTLSNLGAFGVDFFTSILNPPQAAILSVGALAQRPVAIGDAIAVRPTMFVGLTIDHRATDGAAGARFLAELRKRLETAAVEQP